MEFVYGAIPQKEREALIALYNSTNGDNWEDNSGWKEPPLHTDGFALPGTENKWYGITCDADNTTVVRIDLNNNHLEGPIPSELENLTNLQCLYIAGNQLTGIIPTALSNLSNLTELGLNENQLTGTIPQELENLSNLKTLNLYENQLKESIPSELGNLSALTYLDLHSNQLTGPIPPELGNLSGLIVLVLSFNQLTGPIPPPQLGQFSQLKWFQLDSNQLTGAIPSELGQLSQLQWLSLAFNQLTGYIPSELGQLSNLTRLQLDFNQLVGSIPPGLANLTNLQHLSLSFNQLTGTIPSELDQRSNLQTFNLFANQLTGNIPPELGNLSKLNDLSLGSNQLMGDIPPELGDLSQLYYLDLSSNRLTGSIPQDMKKLNKLYIGGSDFRWNGLYTDNESLRNLLNSAQKDSDWENTQTIAPEQVNALAISTTSVGVSWKLINYTEDKGGYRVFYSSSPGGPYTLFNATKSKYDSRLVVTGLNRDTNYYFVVQAWTEPHGHNQNIVESGFCAEVSSSSVDKDHVIISGRVATETGIGIDEVTLNFFPPSEFVVSDRGGNYWHVVNSKWSGIVTPLKTGCTFKPAQITFKNVTSDQPGTDFQANLIHFVISGKVTSAGEGISGVTLTFTGNSGETETVQTDAYGSYSYQVLYGWAGRAAPSKGDLLFYPPFIDYPLPGITGNREHQDYQLSVSLALTAARKQDSTLIIRKEYGEIELNVGLIGVSTAAIQKFIIYRREANGAYQSNNEFPASSQTDNYQFTYRDEYLEKDKTYTYIARAIDAQGKIIGESQEKTI